MTRVMNCICGERLAGDDDDALFAAVRRHSDEAHADLNLPDEAVRTMVQAQSRMTPWDGTQATLNEPPAIVPLTPDRLQDVLRFFDRDAFMDNPIWATCYCYYPHFDGDQAAWSARSGKQNRDGKASLIERGEAHGVLAYAGDRIIGWCNAAPRRSLPMFDRNPAFAADDADEVGSIVCFVVAAPYRGQGVARSLLDAACNELRDQGLAIAEAYPLKDARSAARAHLGTLAMYESAGFQRVREAGGAVIVRKPLSQE